NLHFRTITADLTKIALETIKAPITNTAMVVAFSGATNLIKINEVAEAIKYKFGDVTELAEKNIKAAEKSYEEVRKRILVGAKK
ncbi:MAG: 2-oxoacid:acceptor oxidoreductase family protein, partial [Candidatus Nanoarchaeia archaeon]|nr:2-oxoacid:acceptor oxidoreductase family protein [Candidatus Nanoarchaeia archaeon]